MKRKFALAGLLSLLLATSALAATTPKLRWGFDSKTFGWVGQHAKAYTVDRYVAGVYKGKVCQFVGSGWAQEYKKSGVVAIKVRAELHPTGTATAGLPSTNAPGIWVWLGQWPDDASSNTVRFTAGVKTIQEGDFDLQEKIVGVRLSYWHGDVVIHADLGTAGCSSLDGLTTGDG
jgi:hypothetical protein